MTNVRELDIFRGETRTPEYLAKNPDGHVPLLELPDGYLLPESNAILVYLAEGTPFWPAGRLERAQVLQWMFFEQYKHEPALAVVRFWVSISEDPPPTAEIEARRVAGQAALGAMERHLVEREYLVGECFTIADIALYAYTHVAPEGGFDLEPYPAVCRWLERVAAQPGIVPITA